MSWKISFALVLALSGCASVPEKEYVTIYRDRAIVCNVPDAVPQNMLEVEFIKVFDTEGQWWITADDENYKKLALNNGRILKYLTDLKGQTKAQKVCMEPKKES